MKVLQILLSPRIGGAESLAGSLASEWGVRGVESEIVYLEGTDGPRSSWSRLRHLYREIRLRAPDVVVAHSAIPNIYARLASPRNTPVVIVLHSAGDDYVGKIFRLAEHVLRRRTAALVAVSNSQLSAYEKRFPGILASVIPNGIRSGLPSISDRYVRTYRVVTVARVAPQKRPMFWAAVVEAAKAEGAQLEFEWWGPLEISESEVCTIRAVERRVGKPLLQGPTDDPGAAWARGGVAFHTAVREAHSIGLLEAMAVGLPVVCSESVAATLPGGWPYAVFADDDVAEALHALQRASTEVDRSGAHAKSVQREAIRLYGAAACASRYLDVFEEVLLRRSRGR